MPIPKSRYLLIRQMEKVIWTAIPRLDSLDACDNLESEILRARKGGLIDDKECVDMQRAIQEMRQLYT